MLLGAPCILILLVVLIYCSSATLRTTPTHAGVLLLPITVSLHFRSLSKRVSPNSQHLSTLGKKMRSFKAPVAGCGSPSLSISRGFVKCTIFRQTMLFSVLCECEDKENSSTGTE